MAYYRKLKTGWRAEVVRDGVRKSAVRPTKAEAQAWAVAEEAAILAGTRGQFPKRTLEEAIEKYRKEVISKKPANRQRADNLRLDSLIRDFPWLTGKILHEITGTDLAKWRDTRLETVLPNTVLREAQLYRPIWTIAIREWRWAGESPWKSIKLPAKGLARRRTSAWSEVRLMLRNAGVTHGQPPQSPMQETAWTMLVALHTALRSGEILRMSRSTVDLKRRVYTLSEHKTAGHVGVRKVPLTRRSLRVLQVLDAAAAAAGRDNYFTISDASRDVLYRKLRDRVMVEGLHFHDLRATALTWLTKRVDVMTLARISGHTDINMLYNTYYRETAEDVAARL